MAGGSRSNLRGVPKQLMYVSPGEVCLKSEGSTPCSDDPNKKLCDFADDAWRLWVQRELAAVRMVLRLLRTRRPCP